MATSEPIQVECQERRSSPSIDYQLINVNITSSSPPETDKHQQTSSIGSTTQSGKLAITRANSAKHQTGSHVSCGQAGHSPRSSTITFQEPLASTIKRPNSTIGIPSSMIPNSQSLYNSLSDKSCHVVYGDYVSSNHSSNLNLNPMATIETPESDIYAVDFNPVVREKAASLTLPDSKLHLLRKGSSNPFLTTKNSVSPGQYSLPSERTSIILNGNILHSISPIAPGRPPAPRTSSSHQLSIYVQDNAALNGSGNLGPIDSRLMGSVLKPRGSTMSTMTTSAHHRSSYIGDDEHYHLHQQYLATSGRKDTIISIGKNLQIQFKSPSTRRLSWRYRTCLEKFLLILLLGLLMATMLYLYIPNIVFREQQHKVCTSMECVKTAASLLNAMDLTADPCEDFFQFACGTWVKKHVIPEDKPSTSTFEVMADEMQIILKDILEQPPNSADNSATMKAKRFYQSCMNIQQIEMVGVEPIYRALSEVGGWPVMDPKWDATKLEQTRIAAGTTLTIDKPNVKRYMNFNLENLMGKIRGDFNQPIIVEQYVGPDDRNSSHNIIQFDQTSFGLPSREYFLKEEPNREKDAYLELMVDIAELMGAKRDYALEEMSKVLEFETELANASMPEADRHDTSAIYNKMTIRKLKETVPEFDWMAYLKSFMPMDVGLDEEVVVYSLEYYKKMGKILTRVIQHDKRIIINYAVWRLMKSLLPFLDGEFGVKRAKFRKVLSGISADQNRWRQCVELVNKKMGMAVGALFIKDNFDPASKESALEMIHNIREAFNELLHYNDWMDDETRRVATEKANAINERIGYSESLTNSIELSKEYNNLEIDENQFLENVLNVYRFESLKNLMKLGTTMDKNTWTTDPAVVNAFYSPNRNDIVFPAGVLQPLFYSHHFPKSLNYGGIGVVIGHEITHGFDDRGRQFDKNGNMKQWWNIKTIKRFRSRAQCIVDQYSSYVLEDINANINGRMTQGENIADNGGLKQAYRAFKKWERQYGVEALLPGLNLTHDQLFFLNYAQIWCGSMRPEDALNKVRSSVHSPGPIRVLGPLSNSYDFANAYNCPVGSRMNPVKKCSVW